MKSKLLVRLALAMLAIPVVASSAQAETARVLYNGYLVLVDVTTWDPDCGNKGTIIDSPFSGDIGKVIVFH